MYRLIDQEFHYRFYGACDFEFLKIHLTEWRIYSINNVAQCGTYFYDCYKFISNLEAIKGKKRCSCNLGKIFTK